MVFAAGFAALLAACSRGLAATSAAEPRLTASAALVAVRLKITDGLPYLRGDSATSSARSVQE
ncbi:hypothetical protein [Streptomyces sp. NBC_01750]|uniref:hypothetical protein n=1 Tax=Streptomyces sp. NBC_01750 TaxID=2975928 RepID=UPI002DD89100|nr:hypothetical protein [Streptomyces sp. NBC_01750]WSD30603.1 hypothetical protein OG966_00550 [Streptomyces sp. NBC_01750]